VETLTPPVFGKEESLGIASFVKHLLPGCFFNLDPSSGKRTKRKEIEEAYLLFSQFVRNSKYGH
jgi:hypothetical protein